MSISIFIRNARENFYSLEIMALRLKLGLNNEGCDVTIKMVPYSSTGFLNRLKIILWVFNNRTDNNIILGDITYSCLLLSKKNTTVVFADTFTYYRLNIFSRYIYKFFWLILPLKIANNKIFISNKTFQEISLITYNFKKKIINSYVVGCPISDDIKIINRDEINKLPRLLFIGNAINKNLDNVLLAIKNLSVKLIVIGRLTNIQLNYIIENNIQYENFVSLNNDEINNLYKTSDLLVFLSTYEGFGMPVIEAQSFGLPVVASRIEPIIEIANNSVSYANPWLVNSITNSISKIINDNRFRKELIQKGYINCKDYNIKKISKKYLSIINNNCLNNINNINNIKINKPFFILSQKEPFIPNNIGVGVLPVYPYEILFKMVAIYNNRLYFENKYKSYSGKTFLILQILYTSLHLRQILNSILFVWEGYGLYTLIFLRLIGFKVKYFLIVYRNPPIINNLYDYFKGKIFNYGLSNAYGLITITPSQNEKYRKNYKNVLYVPFCPDKNWWFPNSPTSEKSSKFKIGSDQFILVVGDVDRDDITSLNVAISLGLKLIRVTRSKESFKKLRKLYSESNYENSILLLFKIPYITLKELYSAAKYTFIPTISNLHAAGMTAMTEALSCGACIVIKEGMITQDILTIEEAIIINDWSEISIIEKLNKLEKSNFSSSLKKNARKLIDNKFDIEKISENLSKKIIL